MAATALVGRAEELRDLSSSFVVPTTGVSGRSSSTATRASGRRPSCGPPVPQRIRQGALALCGSCLPLTSVALPLIGLRSAVRGLPAEQRPDFLGTPGAALLAPVAFDEWLGEQTEAGPVVLAVDDLHWADDETLDALLYVLAGAPQRRLAVLLTVRSSDVGPGHRVRGWLADARRLPGVGELRLGPLSRDELEEELALVLGAPAHSTLVDEVHARSGGNPYFARLLVDGLDPSSRALPHHLPEALSAAAVRSWGVLSADARRLVVTLAVGGRPVRGASLARVADIADLPAPGPALHEALDAGMLDVADDGAFWFHHPLQAEALEQGLLPEERRILHAGFAAGYAAEVDGDPSAELAETVSDHYALADDDARSYAWAVRAADLMLAAGDDVGRLRMLRRAAELRPHVPGAPEDLVDVVEAARRSARTVGDWEAELAATDRLRELVDPAVDPLRAAVLAVWRLMVGFRLGLPEDPGDMDRALALSADHPGTWQRAAALCESSRTGSCGRGTPRAAARRRRRRSRSPTPRRS